MNRKFNAAVMSVIFLIGVAMIAVRSCKESPKPSAPHILSTRTQTNQEQSLIDHVGSILTSMNPFGGPLGDYNRGASAFDTKVRFWGKVLDQNGRPVAGASIKATVTTLRMIKVKGGYREYDILATQSAGDGTFEFDGGEGFNLTIQELAKEGYVLPSAYQAGTRWNNEGKYKFRYKSMDGRQKVFQPNPKDSVVFHLWKLNKPEPVEIDGTWAGYDGPEFNALKTTTLACSMRAHPRIRELKNSGLEPDITLEFNNVSTPQLPQWEVTISATSAEGGVAKADPSDAFLFEAPESGYERTIKFRYGTDGTDLGKGEDGFPVRFFVRSKSGRFSAVDSVFFAPDSFDKVVTKWRQWRNPTGSRNLEHDGSHPILPPGVLNP